MHETTHLHINFKCPFSTSNLKWIEFLNYTLQLLQLAESHRLRQDIKEMRPWINDIPPVCNANVRESLGIKGKWYRCIRRSIVIDDRPPRLTRICRRPMEFFTCRHIRTYIYTYVCTSIWLCGGVEPIYCTLEHVQTNRLRLFEYICKSFDFWVINLHFIGLQWHHTMYGNMNTIAIFFSKNDSDKFSD